MSPAAFVLGMPESYDGQPGRTVSRAVMKSGVLPGGRRWVRTTGFSLVRRNTARNTPSSPRRFMQVNCGNNACRCPGMPGIVCTVVPANGSRSSILIPRLTSELGPGGRATGVAPAGWLSPAPGRTARISCTLGNRSSGQSGLRPRRTLTLGDLIVMSAAWGCGERIIH